MTVTNPAQKWTGALRDGTPLTADDLAARLASHADWLANRPGGVRLDLSGANLSGANLSDADLDDANLADANLSGANLARAYLAGANLTRANLAGANLTRANLARANLARAYLAGANLARAYLAGANLARAYLAGANLTRANLTRAKGLGEEQSAQFRILPDRGSVIGWKKLFGGVIACLEIPDGVARLNAIGSRKCRAAEALVIGVYDAAGAAVAAGVSAYDGGLVYHPGETVRPREAFCDDIRIECASGIHFFITKTEAEQYG
jgi:Family of unknown function (DUF5758)/Pentapeptide repeats (8 copies)